MALFWKSTFFLVTAVSNAWAYLSDRVFFNVRQPNNCVSPVVIRQLLLRPTLDAAPHFPVIFTFFMRFNTILSDAALVVVFFVFSGAWKHIKEMFEYIRTYMSAYSQPLICSNNMLDFLYMKVGYSWESCVGISLSTQIFTDFFLEYGSKLMKDFILITTPFRISFDFKQNLLNGHSRIQ